VFAFLDKKKHLISWRRLLGNSRKSPATLLAALFRRRFVVAQALLPVGIVVVALVVTLQAVGTVVLVGTGRRVGILHDGVLRAREVVQAGAGVLAVLMLAISTPWVVERHTLWARLRLRRRTVGAVERVVVNAGDRALAAGAGGSRWSKGRTRSLINERGRAGDTKSSEHVVLCLVTNGLKSLGALCGIA
jgi:hypothetical protein